MTAPAPPPRGGADRPERPYGEVTPSWNVL